MNLIGALAEGEITRDEFLILAWLGIAGEWSGTKEELAEALQWPHTPAHLGKTLRRLYLDGYIESSARERVGGPFELTLPAAAAAGPIPHGETDCGPEALQSGRSRYIASNTHSSKALGRDTTPNTYEVLGGTGTHPRAASAAQEDVEVGEGEDWHADEWRAERDTPAPAGVDLEAEWGTDWTTLPLDELTAWVKANPGLAEDARAELARRGATPEPLDAVARFCEQTPSAVTDTDAWRARHRRGR